MTDRFDIQRRMDGAADDVAAGSRERLENERERERQRQKRLVKLSVGYYFDPVEKVVLRKSGASFVFVRHDRRSGARRTQAEAEDRHFHLIQGGLFWDATAKKLYRKSGQHYVLYSPDRRKLSGPAPTGKERRAARPARPAR